MPCITEIINEEEDAISSDSVSSISLRIIIGEQSLKGDSFDVIGIEVIKWE